MTNIEEATETVQDMLDVMEVSGSCYAYKHNGGDARFQNVLDCLRAKKEQGWISVKDRLPEPGQIVLVHQIYSWQKFEDGAAITIGRLRPPEPGCASYWEFQHYRPDFRSGTIMDNDIICPGSEYITHWMPLPEPPKGE